MTLNILITIVLFIFLIFFLKLLNNISKNYNELIEINRTLFDISQMQREAFFVENELEEMQKLTEQIVDKGTSVIENVHKKISESTFNLFEKIPVAGKTSKVVRNIHNKTTTGIYAKIRNLNKKIGKIVNDKLR